MDKKTWKLWLLASICFLFIGIMDLIEKKYLGGSVFTILGVSYIGLSLTNYKKNNKS